MFSPFRRKYKIWAPKCDGILYKRDDVYDTTTKICTFITQEEDAPPSPDGLMAGCIRLYGPFIDRSHCLVSIVGFLQNENAETTSSTPPLSSSGANVFTAYPSAMPYYFHVARVATEDVVLRMGAMTEWMNDFEQLNLVISSSNPYFCKCRNVFFSCTQNRSSNFFLRRDSCSSINS